MATAVDVRLATDAVGELDDTLDAFRGRLGRNGLALDKAGLLEGLAFGALHRNSTRSVGATRVGGAEADQTGQQQCDAEAEGEQKAISCAITLVILLERADTDSFVAYGVS